MNAHQTEGGAAASKAVLELRLQGLREQVVLGGRRVRRLVFVSTGLLIGLVLLMMTLHFHQLYEYATLGDIEAVRDASEPNSSHIRYFPTSIGKIDFIRSEARETSTLTEYVLDRNISDQEGKLLEYGGEQPQYLLEVRYREGFFITTRTLLDTKFH